MRHLHIKKIYINHYGPLKGVELEIGRGIQVIWGLNEAGKTLAIDALLKLMLGRTIKEFEQIDRVDQFPEGYLLIDNGNEIKIDSTKTLSSHIGIGAHDLRNTFIIRNSDLTINKEKEYYRAVTNRLTGLQTDKLHGLMDLFKDFGALSSASSGAKLSNSKEYDGLKNKRENARKIIDDIRAYISSARNEKVDGLELQNIKIARRIQELKSDIALKEERIRQFEFFELNKSFCNLKEALEEHKEYRKYREQDHGRLLELQSRIGSCQRQDAEYTSELKGIKEKNSGLKERLMAIEGSLGPLQAKAEKINSIKEKISGINQVEAKKAGKNLFYTALGLLGLTFTSLVFLGIYREWLFLVPVLVFTMLFLAFFMSYALRSKKEKLFLKRQEAILDELSACGYKAEGIRDGRAAIASFLDQLQALENEKNNMAQEVLANQKHEQWLLENLKKQKKAIEEEKGAFLKIIQGLGVTDLQHLKRKIDKKKEIENSAAQLFKLLVNKLDLALEQQINVEDMGQNINEIGMVLERKRPRGFDSFSIEEKVDAGELAKQKEAMGKLESQREEVTKKISDHHYKLRDFKERFEWLAPKGSSLKIDNLQRLARAADLAGDLITEIDTKFEVAVQSIAILEDMLSEEQFKISDIFETLSASDYFSHITGGRYQRVFYDSLSCTVKVEDSKGKAMDSACLSHGAYDQLYLAIRMALAEKIIKYPSFFIIDDAFIYSDKERLESQFEMLSRLAGQGWSFIYFTVKEEVKEMAEKFSHNSILTMKG